MAVRKSELCKGSNTIEVVIRSDEIVTLIEDEIDRRLKENYKKNQKVCIVFQDYSKIGNLILEIHDNFQDAGWDVNLQEFTLTIF